MLREIKPEDVKRYEWDSLVIIKDEVLYSADELAEELGLRFMIDFEEDDDDDVLEDLEETEETEETMGETKTRRSTEEIRELIREAVEAGCTRRSEIMDYCDITGPTADRHKDLWKPSEE